MDSSHANPVARQLVNEQQHPDKLEHNSLGRINYIAQWIEYFDVNKDQLLDCLSCPFWI